MGRYPGAGWVPAGVLRGDAASAGLAPRDLCDGDDIRRGGAVRVDGRCFPAGTLVTGDRGQVPVETVRRGDRVLTHRGRFMPVRGIARWVAPTVTLHGHGHPGLRTTAEHPFLSVADAPAGLRRPPPGEAARARARGRVAAGAGTEWVPAAGLAGREWATPAAFPAADVPEVRTARGDGSRFVPDVSPELLELTGRWVTDGRLVGAGRILLATPPREVDTAVALLRSAGWRSVTVTRGLPASHVGVRSVAYARWLRAHLGDHPQLRQIPLWLLGAHEKYRQAFLDGYRSGGGRCQPARADGARTPGKPLAVGLYLLASSLEEGDPPGRLLGEHRYRRVDALTRADLAVPVHDLSVAEDESYVADGIVVRCAPSSG
jgi:hypothetical protein